MDAAPPEDEPDAGEVVGDDLDAEPGAEPDASTGDSAVESEAASDAEPQSSLCPPLAERELVTVPSGVLSEDRLHWTCDHIYLLNGIVFVHSKDSATPQVLTIDPGTLVRGEVAASARGFLVVTRTGRIEALGTADDPIVFTSQNLVGARARDDWGGITLLGAATAGGTRRVEGFPVTVNGASIDELLKYGPAIPASGGGAPLVNDNHDCGTLRYVRVEFASYNAGGTGNESNGIQTYACGSDTELDYVQVHRSGDDGIELFGGTMDLRHIVITGASDDSVDWDDGWRGRGQFIVAQQYLDAADLGFEAGGSSDGPTIAPDPRLFNLTFIGTNGADVGKVGGRLRGGSRGTLRNAIFLGFSAGALDIAGTTAAQNLRTGKLSIRNSVFWRAAASVHFPTGADDLADDADPAPDKVDNIDETVELTAPATLNRLTDPLLRAPFDLAAPDFRPRPEATLGADQAESPSEKEGEVRPPFFDKNADFVGALRPGGSDWTSGWTSFPAN